MLTLIAANRERVTLEDLVGYATTLDLDTSQIRVDLEQRAFREAVELDQDQMLAMEIDGLPSTLVNDRRANGAMPASVYLRAVEKALGGATAHAAR